jgi:hypothetical protein
MCKLLLRNAFSDPGKVPDFLFQHPEVSIEDPVVELGIERLAQKLRTSKGLCTDFCECLCVSRLFAL